MIVFTPDGEGQNCVNDTKCIEQVKQIVASIPGFDIVYDRGANVLDVDVNDGRRKFESDSGISFPVIRKEYFKVLPKPYEPTKEERQSHEATHFFRFVHGVRSASRVLTENTPNKRGIWSTVL